MTSPSYTLPLLTLLALTAGCRDTSVSPTAPPLQATAAAGAVAPLFLQLSASGSHTCGVAADDETYCWGHDAKNKLGTGRDIENSDTPAPVLGGLRFRQVQAGTFHTCAMTPDDQVYCWGWNNYGQLGDGTRKARFTPATGDFGRFFDHVSVGQFHTCGVQDPVLMCWGSNDHGQLGTGDRTMRLAPEQIFTASGSGFRQVSAGAFHTCAVTTDGLANCWGSNDRGVLGIGDFGARLRPTPVVGGLEFRQVAAGLSHTCGVTTDNLAYCWGLNDYGQLGNGTGIRTRVPVAVVRGLQFRSVTVGNAHTCGVTLDDRAFCWGRNDHGQLGTGTRDNRNRPVAVAGGLRFTAVSAGFDSRDSRNGSHTCGLTTANVAYCWGINRLGQLGSPVEGFSTVPVAVGGALESAHP